MNCLADQRSVDGNSLSFGSCVLLIPTQGLTTPLPVIAMKVMKYPQVCGPADNSPLQPALRYGSHFTSAGDVAEDLPNERLVEVLRRAFAGAASWTCASREASRSVGQISRNLSRGMSKTECASPFSAMEHLLRTRIAAFLASTGRCNSVQVSIDGATPHTHDACRGKGTLSEQWWV